MELCACNPMPGPAYVSPKHPICPTCHFTMWCMECGGCRRCRGEAEGFDVDKGTVDARRQGAVDNLLSRLRQGHLWLTETHQELLKTDDLHTQQEGLFLDMLDLWDAMDGMLRDLYGYQDGICIVGPGQRCPEESPVSCRACTTVNKITNQMLFDLDALHDDEGEV